MEKTAHNRNPDAIKNKLDDLRHQDKEGMLDRLGQQQIKRLDDQYSACMRARRVREERGESNQRGGPAAAKPSYNVVGLEFLRNKDELAEEEAAKRQKEGGPMAIEFAPPSGHAGYNVPAAIAAAPAPTGMMPRALAEKLAARRAPPGPPPGAPPGPPPGGPPGA